MVIRSALLGVMMAAVSPQTVQPSVRAPLEKQIAYVDTVHRRLWEPETKAALLQALDSGADPNEIVKGHAPLFYADRYSDFDSDDYDVMTSLLRHGANVHIRDGASEIGTAVLSTVAPRCTSGSDRVTRALLQAGARADDLLWELAAWQPSKLKPACLVAFGLLLDFGADASKSVWNTGMVRAEGDYAPFTRALLSHGWTFVGASGNVTRLGTDDHAIVIGQRIGPFRLGAAKAEVLAEAQRSGVKLADRTGQGGSDLRKDAGSRQEGRTVYLGPSNLVEAIVTRSPDDRLVTDSRRPEAGPGGPLNGGWITAGSASRRRGDTDYWCREDGVTLLGRNGRIIELWIFATTDPDKYAMCKDD